MVGMPAKDAYRKAVEQSRAAEFKLRLASLRRLDQALLVYANKLTAKLKALPKGTDPTRRHLLLEAATNVRVARDELIATMERAVAEGRQASFDEILDIQQNATRRVMENEGVDPSLLTTIQIPNLTMAGVWESLGKGSATWRTLLRGHVVDAVADAQMVVTQALIEGMSPDDLSRRLRPYVLGSEPFQKAFAGAGEITDKMLRNPQFTKAANKLRYNADRIAFSELHNARGEAELQAFAQDPFVHAVRWQLSPNRGKLRKKDACDGLAKTDFFGMGKGVYPVAQVPIFPHPFCRCERVPISRGIKDMKKPKPNPPRKHVDVDGTGCT